MIEDPRLQELWSRDGAAATVLELYTADAVPTSDGFNPNDALACFAAVGGVSFMGRDYQRLVRKFGTIRRNISGEISRTSVTLDNLDRASAQFEFQYGFEGLIMVIRLIDLEESVALSDTQILFAGRCEKPTSGTKELITIPATFIVGSLDVRIPRRKYGPDDNEGRTSDNPEFEGFIHMPQYGTTAYNRIEKRGGFLGWWNKKQVRVTAHWSSYSDYDANKSVPEVFGKVQMQAVLMSADDQGDFLRMRLGWCEGPIAAVTDIRSTDPEMPINPGMTTALGLTGAANFPDEPQWTGPGYYSRTAVTRCGIINLDFEVSEAAPDSVGVVEGRLLYTPNDAGAWSVFQWSDNPIAAINFLLTDERYYGLAEAWLDRESFTEAYRYCDQGIFNTSVDDFIFVEEG